MHRIIKTPLLLQAADLRQPELFLGAGDNKQLNSGVIEFDASHSWQ